ncbi:hypothetical protein JI739_02670 [Ramlibacter sp. AW1]|uniref:Uncharacterized protein n=1 Tax=Ramlibacter aurantiacus TaxID=2801330 RepID=A0A937D3E0_9BURK|nr:hypothetical protein [Ramlibacter aurantiacus]
MLSGLGDLRSGEPFGAGQDGAVCVSFHPRALDIERSRLDITQEQCDQLSSLFLAVLGPQFHGGDRQLGQQFFHGFTLLFDAGLVQVHTEDELHRGSVVRKV